MPTVVELFFVPDYPMPPAAKELDSRRPVWGALSSMFLDADVTLSREWRSEILAASPYSSSALEEILITEIYPICWANLNSAARKKIAFEPAELESMILKRESAGKVFTRLLELARMAIPRSSEWQATKRAIASLRGANPEDQGCLDLLMKRPGAPSREVDGSLSVQTVGSGL